MMVKERDATELGAVASIRGVPNSNERSFPSSMSLNPTLNTSQRIAISRLREPARRTGAS